MHWYTLTPFEQQIFQTTELSALQKDDSTNDLLTWDEDIPNGHMIAAALRNLLKNAMMTLRGPFFCRNNMLYFPNPLNHRETQALVPAAWLPAEAVGKTCVPRSMLWDKRKPAPLVAIDKPGNTLRSEKHDRYLSYKAILQQLIQSSKDASQHTPENNSEDSLDNKLEEQPQTVETQWRRLTEKTGCNNQNQVQTEQVTQFNSGWKLAIALDDITHHKLKKLGQILLIHLGEKQQRFWLKSQNEPFQQQWNSLQEQSQQNRRIAEQSLTHQPQTARVLAYLATPGIFERKSNGVATCRNFPWEWDLAYPADCNQPRGPLVSLATTHPVSINCHCLSKAVSEKDIFAFQVFAAPAGSVYYLEYPTDLFQDQPFLQDGRPNKVHLWRRLGYSELLWMPYSYCDTAVGS